MRLTTLHGRMQLLDLRHMTNNPWEHSSWGQHGAHLGPTGPRWALCWPHKLCYLGSWLIVRSFSIRTSEPDNLTYQKFDLIWKPQNPGLEFSINPQVWQTHRKLCKRSHGHNRLTFNYLQTDVCGTSLLLLWQGEHSGTESRPSIGLI